MGLFGRRRGGFGEQTSPAPTDDYLNLTKYDEKFILPTDGGLSLQQQQAEPSADVATVTAVRDLQQSEPQQAVTATERPMVFLSRAHSDIYI
ncbi:MAG: hypothetical protein K2L54_03440, partial [Clostridiales bacterium]|nr:hypothetical protein [Clostridiales bacterium]